MDTRSVTAPAILIPSPTVEARVPRAPQQAETQLDPQKRDAKVSSADGTVQDAATAANKALSNLSTGIRLKVDQESDQIVAQFVDANDKVIKQIPPEELLHIAASLRKLEGLLFNKQA